MSGPLTILSRLLARTCLAVAGLGLVVMVGLIVWQVWTRYVLSDSPPWSEQAALAAMLMFVPLAAAVGVRERFHIGLTSVLDGFGPRSRRIGLVVADAAVLLFGVALAVWGTELAVRTWTHVVPTLGIPRGALYVPLALSGALTVLFALEHLLAEAAGTKVEALWR